ncbi:hypothetical protein SD70_24855 [Gordoniibacillus kamchatkensis]|uniref:Uncharacterized protein n=1 Tax=Gordoniibacillus kamchatkensis TaxID=1590651 RepID=A0ABR5AE53_9BACL|nr:hypothetical protein SD70_24855 [Paenibacillus sp. VKM B-2647]
MPDGQTKTELLNRLDAVQQAINAQVALDRATAAIDFAETAKTQSIINAARAKVNALPDGQAKNDLQARLDAIEQAIKDAKANSLLTDVTNAVVRAEKYPSRSNILTALNKLAALPTDIKANQVNRGNVADLQERADKLKNNFNQNVADQSAQLALNKATNAVKLFERFPKAIYKQRAIDAVNALPDTPEKTALQARIDAVTLK